MHVVTYFCLFLQSWYRGLS